jgi:hybrid cluster-associated redox disulfide protein
MIEKQITISQKMTVKLLLERYPRAIRFFFDMGMSCLGCPTEGYHSLEDVAREYGYDPDQLISDIRSAVHGGNESSDEKS